MSDIVELIVSNGMSVVIIAYFLFKDWKINSEMLTLLNELKALIKGRKEE